MLCGQEYDAMRQTENAFSVYQKALSIDPRGYQALYSFFYLFIFSVGLSVICEHENKYKEAHYYLITALKIAPHNHILLTNMG